MAAVMFDTQRYIKTLEKFDFSTKQAEGQTEALRVVLEAAFANQTKVQQDVSARAVAELDSKTEKALIKLEAKMDAKLDKLETKMDKLEASVDVKLNKLEAKVDNIALGLRKDMESLDQRMTARFTLLQWMLGALITGVVALLVRAFMA